MNVNANLSQQQISNLAKKLKISEDELKKQASAQNADENNNEQIEPGSVGVNDTEGSLVALDAQALMNAMLVNNKADENGGTTYMFDEFQTSQTINVNGQSITVSATVPAFKRLKIVVGQDGKINVYSNGAYEINFSKATQDLNINIEKSTANLTITGGSGNDMITVQEGAKVAQIDGGKGDDVIVNAGADSKNANIFGGEGDDMIFNAAQSNHIDGGKGDDVIVNAGADSKSANIFGGEGDDMIFNAAQSNHIESGKGDDSIFNFGEVGFISSGDGQDYIFNAGDAGLINGEAGTDTIDGKGTVGFASNVENAGKDFLGWLNDKLYNNGELFNGEFEGLYFVEGEPANGIQSDGCEYIDGIMIYDKDGYDKDGYDRNGFDKNGINAQNLDREGRLYNNGKLVNGIQANGQYYLDGELPLAAMNRFLENNKANENDGTTYTFNKSKKSQTIAVNGQSITVTATVSGTNSLRIVVGQDGKINVYSDGATAINFSKATQDLNINIEKSTANLIITGGSGNDIITVQEGAKVAKIDTGKGDDVIVNAGADNKSAQILGGEGNDIIFNISQLSKIDSAKGDDNVFNFGTVANITSGDGQDNIFNFFGGVTTKIDAGAGDDNIFNVGTVKDIAAGAGDDTITNKGTVSNKIDAGAGNDNIINSRIVKDIAAGTGDDTITNEGSVTNKIDGGNDKSDKLLGKGTAGDVTNIETIPDEYTGMVKGLMYKKGSKANCKINEYMYQDGVLANKTVISNVYYEKGKPASAVYNKKQYVNGNLANGAYKSYMYKDGEKLTGQSELDGKYYSAGKIADKKTIEGKYYIAGEPANGIYYNTLYVDGVKLNGVYEVDGRTYKNGKTYDNKNKAATGVIDGKYYKSGVPATGTSRGKQYVDGDLANGIYNNKYYENGVNNTKFTGDCDGKYVKNGKVYSGTTTSTDKATGIKTSTTYKNGLLTQVKINDIVITCPEGGTLEKTEDGFKLTAQDGRVELYDKDGNIIPQEANESLQRNGEIDISYQGYAKGDCMLLSVVNALSYTQAGKELIKNTLQYNSNGDVTVKFKGADFEINISDEEILGTKHRFDYAQGDEDMTVFELAFEKLEEMFELNKATFAPGNTPNEMGYNILYGLITGKQGTITLTNYNNENAQEIRQTLSEANNINIAMTNGFKTTKKVQDIYGNNVEIIGKHAYAIKQVKDGVVTVVNPWDSGKEIKLNLETFIEECRYLAFVNMEGEDTIIVNHNEIDLTNFYNPHTGIATVEFHENYSSRDFILTYDQDGNLISKCKFINHEYEEKTLYEYDYQTGNLISEEKYDADNVLTEKLTFSIKTGKLLVKETYDKDGSLKNKITYDE